MSRTITVNEAKLFEILRGAVGPIARTLMEELEEVAVQEIPAAVPMSAGIDFPHDEVRVWLGSGDWGAVYVNGQLWLERHHDDIRERLLEEMETSGLDFYVEYGDAYRSKDPLSPRQIACGTLDEVKDNERELAG